ncbi:MAG: hypothetical protein ACFHU9_08340 [Fluviicola sp.]
MKKITVTVAALLFSGMLLAQDYTPPSKAVSTFETRYPDAIVEEWYEGFEDVECYFENNGNFGSAHFTEEGVWMYSEFTIEASEMPRKVSAMLAEDFEAYEVSDVVMTEKPKVTTYAITISNDATDDNRIVTYDASGNLIDEVIITMDDDSFE